MCRDNVTDPRWMSHALNGLIAPPTVDHRLGLDALDELGRADHRAAHRIAVPVDVFRLQLAAEVPRIVTVRRIGEPAQVEPEALNLLTQAGMMPGRRVRARREGARIVVVREGAEEATGVSLPADVAIHGFADSAV